MSSEVQVSEQQGREKRSSRMMFMNHGVIREGRGAGLPITVVLCMCIQLSGGEQGSDQDEEHAAWRPKSMNAGSHLWKL